MQSRRGHPTRRVPPLLAALAAGAASGLCPGLALAGAFAEDGSFVFDPDAVYTQDFVDVPDDGPPTLVDESALAGGQVLELQPFAGAELTVALPAERRTYRVSVWIRGAEAVGNLELSYSDRVDEVAALFPTGRITSDGWVELANERIRVDGESLVRATVGLFSPAGATVDAIEIVPDGDELDLPPVPNAACGGVTDASSCASDQLCVWSVCRNVSGWVPPIPADRAVVTDYLAGRLELLFGPFIHRTEDLPAARVAIEQMKSAQDPWTYWNGFTLAVRRLHDGHTTTNGLADFVLENPRPLSVCFLEGDADLTHGTATKDPHYLDVLVSHTGADHHLGLSPGDRLVRVDGMHPTAWARAVSAVNWAQPAISNHETFAELASGLRRLIPRYAGELEVIRCGPGGASCGEVETISIRELPFDAPDTPVSHISCDNRPLRHLPTSPPDHAFTSSAYAGLLNESDEDERIYGLEWESLYTLGSSDELGTALKSAVASWKKDARGVVMDHRKGTGGVIAGPQILWSFSVPEHASNYFEYRQRAEDEQPSLATGMMRFGLAKQHDAVQFAGTPNPTPDVPVALLITEDVSASDWLALGMKGAPKTRLFGPYQTNGAFSTRLMFSYWLSITYVAAVGDTYLPDGRTINGRGVEPDVVVLPRQSDLAAGKDTVFEAALAWIREEMAP